MHGNTRFIIIGLGLTLCASLALAPAPADDTHRPAVPVGFTITEYARIDGLATSLSVGGQRLFVADFSGGRVLSVADGFGHRLRGQPVPTVFADGLHNPLGVLAVSDQEVFVSDAEPDVRSGPFGERIYGRVWHLADTDGDGAADERRLVLKDLPNGRHNTNGLATGPDGMLYVTNGNSTDDGVEGGAPEAPPWSGGVIRVDPAATAVSVADLDPSSALVATGMRNVYDVAFSPFDPTHLFIPMNGVDDARKGDGGGGGLASTQNVPSDDLLLLADIDDRASDEPDAPLRVEHFGFPSCLFDETRQGDLSPFENPNPDVIARFGPCADVDLTPPVASFGRHVSADGLAFVTSDAWGSEYVNDLFVAEFGNFFGTSVVGHRVVRVEFDASGTEVVAQSEFVTGVLPLDVAFRRGGTFGDGLYIADLSGSIFKVERAVG